MADYHTYSTCMGDHVVMKREYPHYTSPSKPVARFPRYKDAKKFMKEVRKAEIRTAAEKAART